MLTKVALEVIFPGLLLSSAMSEMESGCMTVYNKRTPSRKEHSEQGYCHYKKKVDLC